VKAAPLLQQQQSTLGSLVDKWGAMEADERKQTLAAIFDSVTTDAEAVPAPAGSVERKTGLEPAKSTRELSLNATGRVQVESAPACASVAIADDRAPALRLRVWIESGGSISPCELIKL